METIKTYPPEVEKKRAELLSMIEEVGERYRQRIDPHQPLTALTMSQAPRTPQQFADLRAAYQAECEPFIRRLAELEGFATVSMKVPA